MTEEIKSEPISFVFNDNATATIEKSVLDMYPKSTFSTIINSKIKKGEDISVNKLEHNINKCSVLFKYLSGESLNLMKMDPNTLLELYYDCCYYCDAYQKELILPLYTIIKKMILDYCYKSNDELRIIRLYYDEAHIAYYYSMKTVTSIDDIHENYEYGLFRKTGILTKRYCDYMERFKGLFSLFKIRIYHQEVDCTDLNFEYDMVFNKRIYYMFHHLQYIDIEFLNVPVSSSLAPEPLGVVQDSIKVFFKEHKKHKQDMSLYYFITVLKIEITHLHSEQLARYLFNNPYSNEIEELIPNILSNSVRLLLLKLYIYNQYPSLRVINLRKCIHEGTNITECLSLFSSRDLSTIKSINLSHNQLNSDQCKLICDVLLIKKMPKLLEFNFSNNVLHKEGIEQLSNLFDKNRSFSLMYLILRDICPNSPDTFIPLFDLMKSKYFIDLEYLDISYNPQISMSLTTLNELIHTNMCPYLKDINITGSFDMANPGCVNILFSLLQASSIYKIASFSMEHMSFNLQCIEQFTKAILNHCFSSLKEINLASFDLDDATLVILICNLHRGTVPYLTTLNLSNNKLTDKGIIDLFNTIKTNQLFYIQDLYLHSNSLITPIAYQKVFNELTDNSFQNLKNFTIYDNSLGDEGCLSYLKAIKCGQIPIIPSILLHNTHISDISLSYMCTLIKEKLFYNIEQFDISNNSFSFLTCQLLIENIRKEMMPFLKTLNITNIGLTEEEIDQLKEDSNMSKQVREGQLTISF